MKKEEILVAHDYVQIGDVQIEIWNAKKVFETLLELPELSDKKRMEYAHQRKSQSIRIIRQAKPGQEILINHQKVEEESE